MRRHLIGIGLTAALAISLGGCGGPALKSDADAAKDRGKIEQAAQKGQVPTGQPKDVMEKQNYPGISEAAEHGGTAPAQGTSGQEKYYKK